MYANRYTWPVKQSNLIIKSDLNIMNTLKNIILAALVAVVTSANAFAAKAVDFDLPAAGGFDLVSYHQDAGPGRSSGFHAA